jgi:hypothetical protein
VQPDPTGDEALDHVIVLMGGRGSGDPEGWINALTPDFLGLTAERRERLAARGLLPPAGEAGGRWLALEEVKARARSALRSGVADQRTAALVWMLSLIRLVEPEDGVARLSEGRAERWKLRLQLRAWDRRSGWPFGADDATGRTAEAILRGLGAWVWERRPGGAGGRGAVGV